MDQSDAALKAYEAIGGGTLPGAAIGTETREKLNAARKPERKAAGGQARRKLADAEKQIAANRNAAMSNVRTIAADAARRDRAATHRRAPDAGAVKTPSTLL
jgi:F-type H+-transporting ATPase subunit b